MRGGLGCPAGEAVAGGTRERRLVSVGSERLSENAAKGVVERHALDTRTSGARTAGAGAETGEPGSVGSDQLGSPVVTGQSRAGRFGAAPVWAHRSKLMQWIVEGRRSAVLFLRSR